MVLLQQDLSKIKVFDKTELLETIKSVKEVVEGNDVDQIVWLGDLNADFARKTGHANYVETF